MKKSLSVLYTFVISARSLKAHSLRTFLSTLGVIFGVGSVVTMISIGEGAGERAQAQIRQLGVQNVFLRLAGSGSPDGREEPVRGLTDDDIGLLSGEVLGLEYVVPSSISRQTLPRSGDLVFESIETTHDYMRAFGFRVLEGRFLGALDVRERRLVCVLGHDISLALGAQGRPGGTLRLGNRPFVIVGVLAAREWDGPAAEALPVRNVNRAVFFPFGSLSPGRVALNEIVLHVAEPDRVMSSVEAVRRTLSLIGDRGKAYQVIVPLDLLKHARQTKRTFNLVLGSIAAVSLLVGGIGIMNIMLASVMERRGEIGIRRAVGATRLDILSQFLGESLILTFGGGLAGMGAGGGAALVLSRTVGWPTVVTWWSCALALGMSLLVGLLSGIHPALRAADLDPVEAIRFE